jgi:hypothetical protein
MDTQGSDYTTSDNRPDAATTELYTQNYRARESGSSYAGDTGDQVADTAGEVTDRAKEVVGDTVDRVRAQAVSQIDAQKSKATGMLSEVAQAIRATGDQLRTQDQANIAQFTDSAADQIERVSTYLDNRDFSQVVTEVQRFGRRQPALFIGGAMLLGLAAARFLKSSSEQARSQDRYQGYGDYRYGAGYGTGYGSSAYGNSAARSSYGGSSGYGYGSGYDRGLDETAGTGYATGAGGTNYAGAGGTRGESGYSGGTGGASAYGSTPGTSAYGASDQAANGYSGTSEDGGTTGDGAWGSNTEAR